VAVLIGMAACAGAEAADGRPEIALKARAVVTRDVIELADVAALGGETPPEVAHLALGNAPWLGHVRRVGRVLVKARLLSAGFDLSQFEFTGAEACLVELESLCVRPEEIVAAARRCLQAQFPEQGSRARIELLHEVEPVLVPAGEGRVELAPSLANQGAPQGTARVDVDLVRDGARLKQVSVNFSVKVYEQVAVAARSIGVGEPLTSDNVRFAEREVTPANGAYVRSPDELKGQFAAVPIQTGQLVTRRMMSRPDKSLVINPNQQVFLVVQTPTLRAVTVGRSLSRARLGEVARAQNVSTGREVVGIAVDGSTIQVRLEGQTDD
jgi:flagella basal body P-ring formation protein FlgA